MTPELARKLVEKALANHPAVPTPGALTVEEAETHLRVRGDGVDISVWPNGELAGTARVDPLAARIRLLAYLILALVSAWGAAPLIVVAVLLSGVPLRLLGQFGLLNASLATGVTLGFALWLSVRFSEWVGTLKPSLFDEPVATVTEGVARWPAPHGLDELLRRSRELLLPFAAGLGLLLLQDLIGLNPRAIALDLCSFTVWALVWSQTRSWAAPAPGVTTRTVKAGGEWGEVMLTALDGTRLSLIVAVFSYGVRISGALDGFAAMTHVTHFAVSSLLDSALRLAVIIPVVRAKPGDARTLTLVSLLAALVGDRLLGDVGRVLFLGLGIFLTLRQMLRHSTKDALKQTARFELSLAVGRLIGSSLAALFLGVFGMALGETIGEQVAALLTASRLEPVMVETRRSPPLRNETVRWLTAAAFVLAGVVALKPWVRDSSVPPDSWPTVGGDGWSVRWPGRNEWKTEPDGRSMETTWKGTRFYLREQYERLYDPNDRNAFMAMNHLFQIRGMGCGDLNFGVVGDEFVRCVGTHVSHGAGGAAVLACTFSKLPPSGYAEGERSFLKSFGDSLGRTQQGVTLDECDGYTGMAVEMSHRLEALTQ